MRMGNIFKKIWITIQVQLLMDIYEDIFYEIRTKTNITKEEQENILIKTLWGE